MILLPKNMITRHNKKFPDKKCEIENCGETASKIIRTKFTCGKCYDIILRDNYYKFNQGEDITKDLAIHKSCYKYKCTNKIATQMRYEIDEEGNKQLIPKYCSEECEIKDKKISGAYKLRK